MRTILIVILFCHAIATQLISTAQDKLPPPRTDLAFEASKVPPPDPTRGKPVARVLDQYLYLDQLGGKWPREDAEAKDKIRGLIGPLLHRFGQQEKIAATPEELDEAAEHLLETYETFAAKGLLPEITKSDEEEAKTEARKLADELVVQWKYCRALYERYGGPVIFQQGNTLEPVGAYRGFLEDVRESGIIHRLGGQSSSSAEILPGHHDHEPPAVCSRARPPGRTSAWDPVNKLVAYHAPRFR